MSSTTDARLSKVSKEYDIGKKGYLNDAEAQMRAMDTENKGFLSNKQVNEIVKQTLALRETNKNLRLWLGILVAFTVVLALANLGTAFAAARLAKDTSVDSETGTMLVKGTDVPVTTMSTGESVNLDMKIDEDDESLYTCIGFDELGRLWNSTMGGTSTSVVVQGEDTAFGLSFSASGSHYNETHACLPSSTTTNGDMVCVEFADDRCAGQDERALVTLGHEHRRELFHHYAHGRELFVCLGACVSAVYVGGMALGFYLTTL